MNASRAYKYLVESIGQSTGTLLCAILLTLPEPLDDADGVDGVDALGRSIILVGRHQLGYEPSALEAIQEILKLLAVGDYPDVVHPVVFAPRASAAIAAAVWGPQDGEVLAHGPRNTGKTHALAAAALINAELHLRAGFAGPFLVGWLHDSLLSASTKTGRSLQLPMWGGIWQLKDDARRAIATLGGKILVAGDFVGCKDDEANQRLRIEIHMVLAEELIASMTDGTGVKEDQWDLARSSTLRLPTRRRVAMAATNPGGPDTWPYKRWLTGRIPKSRVAIQVPSTDRLTPEQQAANRDIFAYSPVLQQRLADGEWVMAEQGAAVAEGFDSRIHVSRTPLVPHPAYLLAIGWDGGHSPSAVIGQFQQGQVSVYASLNALHVGVLELIETQVWPWLHTYAPWTLLNGGMDLVHIIDPNMATPGQATITESAERVILQKLGGRIVYGAVRWPPRREAILRLLAPRHERGRMPLQIDPSATLLIEAFEGRWFYEVHPTTEQIDRTRPKKPNSPWADVGDATAYLAGWLLGGELMDIAPSGQIKVEMDFSLDSLTHTVYSPTP